MSDDEIENLVLSLREPKTWLNTLLVELAPDKDVEGHISEYLVALRDGKPIVREFCELLAEQIVNYCIPRKKRLAALKAASTATGSDTSQLLRLRREARRLFQEYCEKKPDRSGEAGELLIYCLTEHCLRASLVLAKMRLKTNNNMPVFGSDGLHIRFDAATKTLEVYFLESKVHKSFKSGIAAAAKSIGEVLAAGNQDSELRLALDFGNLDTLDPVAQNVIASFLDPYGSNTTKRHDGFSSLVVCEDQLDYKRKGLIVQDALRDLNAGAPDRKAAIEAALAAKGVESGRAKHFVIAVPDVAEFRKYFEEALANG